MKKQIWNHLLHRFKTSKLLLIVYGLAVIMGFMMLSSTEGLRLIEDREQILTLLSMNDVAAGMLLLLPILYTLMLYKMYQDYRYGELRWLLLTKKKAAYVIGDTLFLIIVVVLFYVLCYGLLRYGMHARIQAFDPQIMRAYGFLQERDMLYRSDIVKLFYPLDGANILHQLSAILLQCIWCVCAARYLVKGKKHFLDLLLLLVGWIVLGYAGIIHKLFIQSMLYIVLCIIYYREACKTWSVGREKDIC